MTTLYPTVPGNIDGDATTSLTRDKIRDLKGKGKLKTDKLLKKTPKKRICICKSSSAKINAFGTTIGGIFFLIGFASPLWSSRSGSNEGLWQKCERGICSPTPGSSLGGQAWFILVQTLMTLVLVAAVGIVGLNMVMSCRCVCKKGKQILKGATGAQFGAAALILIGLMVYMVKAPMFFHPAPTYFNYSFWIILVAFFMFFFGGMLTGGKLLTANEKTISSINPTKI